MRVDFEKYYESIVQELEEELKKLAKKKNWKKYYNVKMRLAKEKAHLEKIKENRKNKGC